MYFDFNELQPTAVYKLLVSTVVPRPIAWVVSQGCKGTNAAPFSFFNVVCASPPVLALGIGTRPDGSYKDTSRNILETGQFVVNLVSQPLLEAMNITAIEFEDDVNELEAAGLRTLPSNRVSPPRIADSPVAFECELLQRVDLGQNQGLLLGRVLACHIDDSCISDPVRGTVNTPVLDLVGRMQGAAWYVRTDSLIQVPRLTPQSWAALSSNPISPARETAPTPERNVGVEADCQA